MNVSKLTKVKIKDIWKTEDRDFTPWLVENITRLNEDIGFNIQDPQKENRLENFIVDIVAEDDEGKVIIENQYNKSDHDHLGKLLTYLSNVQGTKKAIWIVEEARAIVKNLKLLCKFRPSSAQTYAIIVEHEKTFNCYDALFSLEPKCFCR
jgi:hypothetical protein